MVAKLKSTPLIVTISSIVSRVVPAISETNARFSLSNEFNKVDSKFSEKWELKIEERELSLKEQAHAYNNWLEKQNYNPKHQSKIIDIDKLSESNLMTILQSLPGPTKLITLTYNNETIESYE